MASGIGGGLNLPFEAIGALLDRLHFDGFVSGSQVVYKIPVLESGGTITMLKIITGTDSFTTTGASITFAESFLYAPKISLGIEFNTVNTDISAPYCKDISTSGFTGSIYYAARDVAWVAVGIHTEAV